MKNSTNNNAMVAGALLAGVAIGGILGILFAPAKGSETRKKFTRKSNEIKDDIKARYDELVAETKILKDKLTA